MALLEFLVTPAADLALAHALKSPLFACSDDDLQQIAARPKRPGGSASTHWRKLTARVGALTTAPQRAARLLAEWLALAPTLPAHDLLDHIYDSGEVMARYRRAVPEARRAAARANLEALLLLALDVDGGATEPASLHRRTSGAAAGGR